MRGLRLGIVGAEGAKFTPVTELLARKAIRDLIAKYQPVTVVSGECHLGGVDIWARLEALAARKNGLTPHEVIFIGHPAEVRQWEDDETPNMRRIGYKTRNLRIVADSDIVVCVTIDVLPPGFNGLTHAECYHHPSHPGRPNSERHPLYPTHVKSGGCWTMEQAKRKGKHGELIVIKTPSAEYAHGLAHMKAIPHGGSWDANGSPV